MSSFSLASYCFISALVCHLALSNNKVVLSCHPGSSRSSCLVRCCRNVIITLLSVFACVRQHQMRPLALPSNVTTGNPPVWAAVLCGIPPAQFLWCTKTIVVHQTG